MTAVRFTQVKHINPAVVGERDDSLRGLFAAAAAHAEGCPCSCDHKTNQATSAIVLRDRGIEIAAIIPTCRLSGLRI